MIWWCFGETYNNNSTKQDILSSAVTWSTSWSCSSCLYKTLQKRTWSHLHQSHRRRSSSSPGAAPTPWLEFEAAVICADLFQEPGQQALEKMSGCFQLLSEEERTFCLHVLPRTLKDVPCTPSYFPSSLNSIKSRLRFCLSWRTSDLSAEEHLE